MSEKVETKVIVKNKISQFLKRGDNGDTILHYVVKSNNEVFAKQLIDAGCDVNEKNNYGEPPLILAIRCNHLNIVKILLDAGAHYENEHFENNEGALHYAADCGHPEIVQLLINLGADVNAKSHFLHTPLHSANGGTPDKKVADDRCRVIKILVAAGADINAKDNKDWTPLLDAAVSGFHAGFELMLSMGANIDLQNMDEDLMYEILVRKDLYILQRLVDLGIDINFVDRSGDSYLHLVVHNADYEILEFLLNNGAAVNSVNNKGENPLCSGLTVWAETYTWFFDDNVDKDDTREHFINLTNCLNLFINRGANVNYVTNNGMTPLYVILQNYRYMHSDFLRILLKNGAKLNFDHPSVNEVMNNSNASKYSHLLLKHTALFQAQNREDGPENFDFNKLNEISRKDYARCRDELEQMKAIKINETNITFFSVLVNRDIGPYTRNEHIVSVFKESILSKRFPIYGDLLCDRFSKELEYQTLVDKATSGLSHILNWDRNSTHILLSNVLRYLDEKDLNNIASI